MISRKHAYELIKAYKHPQQSIHHDQLTIKCL